MHAYVSPNLSYCSQVNVYCVISNVRSSNSKRYIYSYAYEHDLWQFRFIYLKKNNRERDSLSHHDVTHTLLLLLLLLLSWSAQARVSSIYFSNLDASMYREMMNDNLLIYDSHCLLGEIVEKTNWCCIEI